jgi:hypothetical protein
MDYQEAIKYVDELDKLIETGGSPNPETVRRIEAIVFVFKSSSEINPYIREKIASIEKYSRIIFGYRKYDNIGDYEKYLHFLRIDCSNLRKAISRLFKT